MKKLHPFPPAKAAIFLPAALLAITMGWSCGHSPKAGGSLSPADLEQEGRALFFQILKKEFRMHPRAFSLEAEDVSRLLHADGRLPGLDRAVLRLLYLERGEKFPRAPEAGAPPDPEFRQAWLGLCREGASRFVESLFTREDYPRPDSGTRTVLEWTLSGLGLDPSPETVERDPGTGSRDSSRFTRALRRTGIDRAHSIGRGEGTRIVVIEAGPGTLAGYAATAIPPWNASPRQNSPPDAPPASAAAAAAAPGAEVRVRVIPFDPGSPYRTWSAVQTALAVREAARSGARVVVVAPVFTRDYPCLREACLEAYNRHALVVGPNGPDTGKGPETPQSFPAHYTSTLAVAAVTADRSGRLEPMPSAAASHSIDLAAPAFGGAAKADPSVAAALAGGAAALVAALMPPTEDELSGQYFQRIREILVHAADAGALDSVHFHPRTGYGLLNAEQAVGPGLEAYRVKRKQMEEDYQRRLKARAEAEEQALKDRKEAEARKEEKRP